LATDQALGSSGIKGEGEFMMMSGLLRQIRYSEPQSRIRSGLGDGAGFALKVIGVGVFAGLMLTYCNVLLDACLSGIR
jgi:hypothetical protein